MANKYPVKFRYAKHSDEPLKAKIVSAKASTIFESHLHCITIEFDRIFVCHFPGNSRFSNYRSNFILSSFLQNGVVNVPFSSLDNYLAFLVICKIFVQNFQCFLPKDAAGNLW